MGENWTTNARAGYFGPMGNEWLATGAEPTHDDKGELCVKHRGTVLKPERNGAGFVVVACRCRQAERPAHK